MKRDYNSIDELISAKSSNFSKTEIKIASFFLEKQNEIAFMSIHDLADRLGVGRATILRFTNKLGFKGFFDLKKVLASNIHSNVAPLEKFKLMLEQSAVGFNSINQIAENEVANINYIINNYDEKAFAKGIDILNCANYVYTIGYDLSSFMAGITSYLLKRIGLKSSQINLGSLSFPDQLVNVGKNDVLVTFSLPPYSLETINAAKFVKDQKAKVISFTNSPVAPIIEYSDVTLLIKTDSKGLTNSLSAPMVLIYSLINEIAAKDKNRSVKVMNRIISAR